jgi:hypothetical protein
MDIVLLFRQRLLPDSRPTLAPGSTVAEQDENL